MEALFINKFLTMLAICDLLNFKLMNLMIFLSGLKRPLFWINERKKDLVLRHFNLLRWLLSALRCLHHRLGQSNHSLWRPPFVKSRSLYDSHSLLRFRFLYVFRPLDCQSSEVSMCFCDRLIHLHFTHFSLPNSRCQGKVCNWRWNLQWCINLYILLRFRFSLWIFQSSGLGGSRLLFHWAFKPKEAGPEHVAALDIHFSCLHIRLPHNCSDLHSSIWLLRFNGFCFTSRKYSLLLHSTASKGIQQIGSRLCQANQRRGNLRK